MQEEVEQRTGKTDITKTTEAHEIKSLSSVQRYQMFGGKIP